MENNLFEDPIVKSYYGRQIVKNFKSLFKPTIYSQLFSPETSVETGVHKTYVKCLLCGYKARSLTNHLRHFHKILAVDYKDTFGLCHNQPLECEEVTELRREAVKNNIHVLDNLLHDGVATRFQKGSAGNDSRTPQRLEILKRNKKK